MFFVVGILLFAFAAQGIWMLTGPEPMSVAPMLVFVFNVLLFASKVAFIFFSTLGVAAGTAYLLHFPNTGKNPIATMASMGAGMFWCPYFMVTLFFGGAPALNGMSSLATLLTVIGCGVFVMFAAMLRFILWGEDING